MKFFKFNFFEIFEFKFEMNVSQFLNFQIFRCKTDLKLALNRISRLISPQKTLKIFTSNCTVATIIERKLSKRLRIYLFVFIILKKSHNWSFSSLFLIIFSSSFISFNLCQPQVGLSIYYVHSSHF